MRNIPVNYISTKRSVFFVEYRLPVVGPAVLTYRIPNDCGDSQLPPVLTDPDGVICKREGSKRFMEFLEPYPRVLLIRYQGHFF